MGMISSSLYRIVRILLEQQSGDPAVEATRWQFFAKSGGLYQEDLAGVVSRLLTSADLSSLEAHDADLTIIAALSVAAGKFIVGRDPGSGAAWASDYILPADVPNLAASKITSGQLALTQGGTGVDLSTTGGTTKVLAQDASHVVSARNLIAADIPSLSATYQPRDGELDAFAALTSAADKIPYFTGSGAAALADFSAFIRTLTGATDASAARTTLGIVIGTDVQAWDADLDALKALSTTGFAKRTGTNTWTLNNLASVDLSDFTEAVQDVIGALVVTGTDLTITYDDAGNTLTIAVAQVGGSSAANVHAAELLANAATAANTASALVRRDANGVAAFTAIDEGWNDFTATGGTVTLTAASAAQQRVNGTLTETYKLPAANTVALGKRVWIRNASVGALTVQDNSGVTLHTLLTGQEMRYFCRDISTAAGLWSSEGAATTQPLSNKTLITPTISDFTNAVHDHSNAAGGGQITDAALSAAVGLTKGGTGAITAGAARTNLGLAIGTNVQAWDNDLDLISALTGGGIPKRASGNTWSLIGGELFLSAAGGTPSLTNGCSPSAKWETATNKQDVWTLDFNKDTIQYAQWLVWMPAAWDGSTITYAASWTAASSTGDVIWTLEARAYADGDNLDQAFGSGIDVTDTLLTVLYEHISATSAAVTIAGSPAAGRPVIFRVSRKASAGGDTLSADARLMGVKIFFGVS